MLYFGTLNFKMNNRTKALAIMLSVEVVGAVIILMLFEVPLENILSRTGLITLIIVNAIQVWILGKQGILKK